MLLSTPDEIENETLNRDEGKVEIKETALIAIRVYKIRWYMLTVICLVNITNAINWICYSSIANKTGEYYDISYDQVNYLSLTYLILTIPIGFFSFILIDLFGLRLSIFIGVWFNFIGAFVKMFSSFDNTDAMPLVGKSNQYTVLMIGQCLCAIAQPFVIFISTKFANIWFAENQRSLANTIALSSNTFGIFLGAFISPIIISLPITGIKHMNLLNIICCVLSLLPAFMSFFIARSSPKVAPSYSTFINKNENKLHKTKFLKEVKIYIKQCVQLFKSKEYLILSFCFAVAVGLLNTFTTLVEQIFCTRGYSNSDSGYFIALMIAGGIIGSLISGVIIDKTKKYELVAKVCFLIATIFYCVIVVVQLFNINDPAVYYIVYVFIGLFGFFATPIFPVCMDMSIECVYPIPEAMPVGILFLIGQIFGAVFIVGYPKLAREVDISSKTFLEIQTCVSLNVTSSMNITSTQTDSKLVVLDFTIPLITQAVLFFLTSLLFCIFFKCSYRRCQIDQNKVLPICNDHEEENEEEENLSVH